MSLYFFEWYGRIFAIEVQPQSLDYGGVRSRSDPIYAAVQPQSLDYGGVRSRSDPIYAAVGAIDRILEQVKSGIGQEAVNDLIERHDLELRYNITPNEFDIGSD